MVNTKRVNSLKNFKVIKSSGRSDLLEYLLYKCPNTNTITVISLNLFDRDINCLITAIKKDIFQANQI
jgi:hypothetical protein